MTERPTKVLAALMLLSILVPGCRSDGPPVRQVEGKGRALAQKHCQSCHAFPDPALLNQSTWRSEVLPRMAPRFGLDPGGHVDFDELQRLGLVPDTATISWKEWNLLAQFYLESAPLLLPHTITRGLEYDLQLFSAKDLRVADLLPFITMIVVDPQTGNIYAGSDHDQRLYLLHHTGVVFDNVRLPGAPSHLVPKGNILYVLTMGKVLPHNQEAGSLHQVPLLNPGKFGEPEAIIRQLQRPVHFMASNQADQTDTDFLIANFGNEMGELALYRPSRHGDFLKETLRPLPGAIRTESFDFNQDGHPDFLTLMAQGEEGFFLYLDQGDGTYQEQQILRFQPAYGSTYFELVDFDSDGDPDILYVNGDNGDYLPLLKPYHGIRLFVNQGNQVFEEVFFLQHHGAFRAHAVDFDQDGDLDIASISYFPDYTYPEESFIYFENQGDYDFIPMTFENSARGKWLVMDTGDVDLDGDVDIVLGSAMFLTPEVPPSIKKKWEADPIALTVLYNQLN